MRASLVVPCVFLLAALGSARRVARGDPPPPVPSVAQAADAVARSDAADAAVAAVAALDAPDPWLVADELLARGAVPAARRFARAAGARPDVAALARAVDAAVATPTSPDRRAALADAARALGAGDAEAALAKALALDVAPRDLVAARGLFLRGKAAQELRRFEASVAAFDEAASRATELGWLAGGAAALEQAARSASRRSDFEGTLATALRWKRAESDLRCERGVARASFLEALALQMLGRTDDAEARATDALAVARRVDDPEAEASLLNVLAAVAYTRGQTDAAIERATAGLAALDRLGERRVAIARFEPDPRLLVQTRATLWMALSSSAALAGDDARADEALERGREAAERGGSPAWAARVVEMAAARRAAAGDPLGAVAQYERALALVRRAGDRASEARTLRRLGDARRELGDLDAALAALEPALALQTALGDRSEAARTLDVRSLVFEARGDLPAALAAAEAARELARALADPVLEGSLLRHVGDLEAARGAIGRAFAAYDLAVSRFTAAGRFEDAASAQLALGAAWDRAGDGRTARRLFDEVAGRAKATGDGPSEARALCAIATLDARDGDDAAAVPALRRALELLRAAGDVAGAAFAARSLGAALPAEAAAEAAALLREALAAHEAARDRAQAAIDRLELARVLLAGHDARGARAMLADGVARADASGDLDAAVRLRWGLASVDVATGDPRAAHAGAARALASIDAVGADLSDEEGAEARAVYAGLADVGATAALALDDLAGTFACWESGRARTLLAGLAARDALRAVAVPAALRDEEVTARAAEAVARARLAAALPGGDRGAIRAARTGLDEARARVGDVIARIERDGRSRAAVVYPRPAPLADALALLAPDEAGVVYGFAGDRAFALVLRPDGARVVALGARADVEAACRALVPDDGPDLGAERVAAARRRLFEPLALPPTVRRLRIAPVGALAFVPPPLIFGDREVVLVPSMTTAAWLARDTPSAPGVGVLALGDPDYEASGPRLADAPVLAARAGFAPLARLPGTRAEAQAVGDVVLLSGDATERGLRTALEARPRWRAVHIACHGILDRRRATLCALALTPDAQDDGYLTTLDVFRLAVPADLAVLSACETGRGAVLDGEGVIGFVRAFLFAGPPRVLVSLWKVDDDATRALMTRFHALWTPKDGAAAMPAAAALAAAQAAVRADPRWGDPRYWAAWQLWGRAD